MKFLVAELIREGVWTERVAREAVRRLHDRLESLERSEGLRAGEILWKIGFCDQDFFEKARCGPELVPEVDLPAPSQMGLAQLIGPIDLSPSGPDESLSEDYLYFFDEEKRVQMENMILGWEKSISADSFRDYFRELHTLKGTARFVQALLSERLVHRSETLLSDLIPLADLLVHRELAQISDFFLFSLDLLWELREALSIGKGEIDLAEDPHFLIKVQKMFNIESQVVGLLEEVRGRRSLDSIRDKF